MDCIPSDLLADGETGSAVVLLYIKPQFSQPCVGKKKECSLHCSDALISGALITGGYDGASYLNTVELFMPSRYKSCKESKISLSLSLLTLFCSFPAARPP